MNLREWLEVNRPKFGSEYELLFAEQVLPLIPELRLDAITVQHPFQDTDRRQRYCDFVIHEGEDVRIAIEIDGYDKRGTGSGMSHADFIDWQRRQAALTSQGWYVLRFANRDVRDQPERCAEHISLLLKRSRGRSTDKGLSPEDKERLDALNRAQLLTIEHLSQERTTMKYTVASLTALVAILVIVVVWQAGGLSGQPQGALPILDQAAKGADAGPRQEARAPIATETVGKGTAAAGATCESPVDWEEAGQYIGKTVAVAGPVMRIARPTNVRGNPTWIDVGSAFPDRQRLALVIWGEQQAEFPGVQPGQLQGASVCVVGLVQDYKGTAQIELRYADQLSIAPARGASSALRIGTLDPAGATATHFEEDGFCHYQLPYGTSKTRSPVSNVIAAYPYRNPGYEGLVFNLDGVDVVVMDQRDGAALFSGEFAGHKIVIPAVDGKPCPAGCESSTSLVVTHPSGQRSSTPIVLHCPGVG